ncbi:hypothetical protein [Roseateles chitosanitabidus]|uniref:hypothetical protein n=1 Tax=Roseateles chitosanitabidus TaxID=65048 RepID=UPI00083596E6|nr:hypothetical protein [Roseateles chitosanitabidus]
MSDQVMTDADVFGGEPAPTAAGQPMSDADVFAPAQTASGAAGAPTWFSGASGDEHAGQFAIVDLGDVKASHDADMRPTGGGKGIEPEERDRADMEQRVQSIVRDFDPSRLGGADAAGEGAPVVGEDGHVEAGNMRAVALQRIFRADGLKADAYRDFLRGQAPSLGLDPTLVDALKQPVLVRVRTTPGDRAGVGRDLKGVDIAPAMLESAAELGAARDVGPVEIDGSDISPETLDIISFLGDSAGRPDDINTIMAAARKILDGHAPEDAVGRQPDQDQRPSAEAPGQSEAAPGDRGGDQGHEATESGANELSDWQDFPPETEHLGVAREDMPQIRQEHRGALTQFLLARGIPHEQAEVPADSLKPTQSRWSMSKVAAVKRDANDHAVLVSEDGRLLDGHHRWLAALADDAPVRVIRFAAPIEQLLGEAKQFPSSESALSGVASEGTGPSSRNTRSGPR